jgi:hypothetical protein
MTEEQAPYHVSQDPAEVSAHEHLYRVVFGNKIALRFCERCGKSWLLSELRDLISNHSGYEWSEILEEAASRETLISRDAQPRLKRYINE